MKRGQISVEYLIVVGFVVFAVISILAIAIYYTSNSKDRIKSNQIRNFADKIISSSESVFFAGEPSQATITAYLPGGVQSLEILENKLVFNLTTNSGITVVAYQSEVPIELQGSFSTNEGLKSIKILAGSDNVFISEN
jgi:uncharacterized protein (UPF0333 family)